MRRERGHFPAIMTLSTHRGRHGMTPHLLKRARRAKGPRNPIVRYARWLHTRWPAGTVEPLPEVQEDGSTRVPGLYIVGDLAGVPLLKFSADTGSRVVEAITADP